MHTLITLDEERPGPVPFLRVHPALAAPTAGVEVHDHDGDVVMRISSTDPQVLGEWARTLSEAADRLAAEQVNTGSRRRLQVADDARRTADAVVQAVDPARRGLGLLRRASTLGVIAASGVRAW